MIYSTFSPILKFKSETKLDCFFSFIKYINFNTSFLGIQNFLVCYFGKRTYLSSYVPSSFSRSQAIFSSRSSFPSASPFLKISAFFMSIIPKFSNHFDFRTMETSQNVGFVFKQWPWFNQKGFRKFGSSPRFLIYALSNSDQEYWKHKTTCLISVCRQLKSFRI